MNKIPVYFMPGLGASSLIFEHIKLDEQYYEMFFLEWKIPLKNESLQDYAKRMCDEIKHENPILIGVSFGGLLVQEMNRIINVRKTIIISSVKCNKEFPTRMKLAKLTKLYKILPTSIIKNIEDYMPDILEKKVLKGRKELY